MSNDAAFLLSAAIVLGFLALLLAAVVAWAAYGVTKASRGAALAAAQIASLVDAASTTRVANALLDCERALVDIGDRLVIAAASVKVAGDKVADQIDKGPDRIYGS